jgi:Zn-dependent protease with chaperone function
MGIGSSAASWMLNMPLGAVLIGMAVLTAIGLRTAWMLGSARRGLHGLISMSPPPALALAIQRTRCREVVCLDTTEPLAFCAGALRPRLFVSRGLIENLRPLELQAVLLHEAHHARRRDPLRRATVHAAGDVLFFAPLMSWWARRYLDSSELAADRAAMSAVGTSPVAGALCVIGGAPAIAAAGFSGAADLRARQLLGLTLRAPTVPGRVRAATAAGTAMNLAVGSCLGGWLLLFLR